MKILGIAVLIVFSLYAVVAWGEPFMDDFERPDSDDLGNDWSTQADGTITVEIVNNEVLIAGTQGTDWVRSGLSRTIEGETKIYFDFMAVNQFNVHMRIDGAGAYIDAYCWPGGPINYASSEDGSWPGWTNTGGPNMISGQGQYNRMGVEQEGSDFYYFLNDAEVVIIENKGITNITKLLIASDSAAGTTGSLNIDNVVIGDPEANGGNIAVGPAGKLAACWGRLKKF